MKLSLEKGHAVTFYCSQSHIQGEFEHFLLSPENLLGNIKNQDPVFTVLLGDLNARSKSYWIFNITKNIWAANGKFLQNFLTCRAKIGRRSKMS